MPKPNTRAQLLATAADLFYRDGFRAVGVDTISAASGVGKMTLYRHFSSKDALIAAYLDEANAQFWAWFESQTADAAGPREKILAFFDALGKLASAPTCHGCPFLNAAVDFPDAAHPGHAVALAHKSAVHTRFSELAALAGHPNPQQAADHLLLLMDGALISVRLYGPGGPATQVRQAAEKALTW
jgi:AcrR family transcriptional regulator